MGDILHVYFVTRASRDRDDRVPDSFFDVFLEPGKRVIGRDVPRAEL
jgi:hypothetical protein